MVGLTDHQVNHVVEKLGLESEHVEVTADLPLLSLICAHVRFGLPVILLAFSTLDDDHTLHATTIAGFGTSERGVLATEVSPTTEFPDEDNGASGRYALCA